MPRDLDIVVFGATGFTGTLVSSYLAHHAGPDTRWGIAGRNDDKLHALRAHLVRHHGVRPDLPILLADSNDRTSLEAMAQETGVVLTTVGPYALYGEPLVEVCVESGTHYLDLTGEPRWWREVIDRHHDHARKTGAKIICACGFDSVPFDLGALFTASQLPADAPKLVRGYLAARGSPSGGTVMTALDIMSKMRNPTAARGTSGGSGRPRPRGLHHSDDVNAWVLPLPSIDPLIVRRSSELSDAFGPEFTYHHYIQRGSLPNTLATLAGAGALFGASKLALARRFVSSRIPPGVGPSAEQRARHWFRAKFFGEGGGQRVVTEVRGGDPGYDETAKMISEAALCLVHDAESLPSRGGGVLTTASALGLPLVERLGRAGLGFRVLEGPVAMTEERSA